MINMSDIGFSTPEEAYSYLRSFSYIKLDDIIYYQRTDQTEDRGDFVFWKNEAEKIIKKVPQLAYYHALKIGRWLAAEPYIMVSSEYAYFYARDILGRRWPEAEPWIKIFPRWALYYAKDVIKDRWPEIESKLPYDYWEEYTHFLYTKGISEETKLRWIKEEGITNNLFKILNLLVSSEEVQEVIIQLRPDLIDKITCLSPKLKEKYEHELNLSGVEI